LFPAANKMTLRINFMDPTAVLGPGYNGDFDFTLTEEDGVIELKYANPQPAAGTTYGNARVIEKQVVSLLNYFNNQQFAVRWVEDIVPQSKSIFGGLVKVSNPNSYVFGTL